MEAKNEIPVRWMNLSKNGCWQKSERCAFASQSGWNTFKKAHFIVLRHTFIVFGAKNKHYVIIILALNIVHIWWFFDTSLTHKESKSFKNISCLEDLRVAIFRSEQCSAKWIFGHLCSIVKLPQRQELQMSKYCSNLMFNAHSTHIYGTKNGEKNNLFSTILILQCN